MPRDRGGQDPTRDRPGGSTTAAKIAADSPLGSDNAAEDGFAAPADPPQPSPQEPSGRARG